MQLSANSSQPSDFSYQRQAVGDWLPALGRQREKPEGSAACFDGDKGWTMHCRFSPHQTRMALHRRRVEISPNADRQQLTALV